ncbi:hypothetical protein FIBSPDRAFT_877429 [Athelia psychrophila]|uniref:Uncharacterized protein n=1 Tax=Athelia psychrophila TaxID=1759441 RepID=A0A167VZ74_9AGAM|nr:hypothetical protein FIBSPDRAFT_877429 [Fibularhizoctonia sp. CBS 109695]
MRFTPVALLVVVVVAAATSAVGGPISYDICVTSCNAAEPPGSSAHNACKTYCFVNLFRSPDP